MSSGYKVGDVLADGRTVHRILALPDGRRLLCMNQHNGSRYVKTTQVVTAAECAS
jgi:hypothetical protein